jgi:uncharacterized protein YrrD
MGIKKLKDVFGLSVIDIVAGNQIGYVYDVIINGETGDVDYIVVDDGSLILGAKIIQTKNIEGVGINAITINKKEAVQEILKVEKAVQLFKSKIRIMDTKVLTQKGKLIGKIGEVYIDENDFSVKALEFISSESPEKTKLIPRGLVLTFGENFVIVVENAEENFTDVFDPNDEKMLKLYEAKRVQRLEEPEEVEQPKKEEEKTEEKIEEKGEEKVEEKMEEKAEEKTEEPKKEEHKEKSEHKSHSSHSKNEHHEQKHHGNHKSNEDKTATNLFEQKQKEFLLGRKVTKDIKDKEGNIILAQGEAITNELIDKAKQAGKFIEVVMNNTL